MDVKVIHKDEESLQETLEHFKALNFGTDENVSSSDNVIDFQDFHKEVNLESGIIDVTRALNSMTDHFVDSSSLTDQAFAEQFREFMPFLITQMGAKPSVAKVTCSAIEKIVMLRPRAFSEFACILISHLSKHFAGLETLQLATEQCCEDFILYIPDNEFLMLEKFAEAGFQSSVEKINCTCFNFVYILLSKHTSEQKISFPNSPQLQSILKEISNRQTDPDEDNPLSILNLLAVLHLYYPEPCQSIVSILNSEALDRFNFFQIQYLLEHDLKGCFQHASTMLENPDIIQQCRSYFINTLATNIQFVDSSRFTELLHMLEEAILSEDSTSEHKSVCIAVLGILSAYYYSETEELISKLTPDQKVELNAQVNDVSSSTPVGFYTGDSDDDDSDSEDGTDEFQYETLEDIKQHLLDFLNADERLTWRMIDFLTKDDVFDVFFGYLSHIENHQYFIVDEDAETIFADLDFTASIEPCREPDRDAEEKNMLSFSLMAHFHPESMVECVKLFLIQKMAPIVEHVLACFHPASSGNVYHAAIVLSTVVRLWSKTFIITILDKANLKQLFRNVVLRCMHWGHVEDALVDLLATPVRDDAEFMTAKTSLFVLLSQWEVIETYCAIIASPETSFPESKIYFHILRNLLDRLMYCDSACKIIKEGQEMKIVSILMDGALNVDNPNRVHSADMLTFWIRLTGSEMEFDPMRAMLQGLSSDPDGSEFLHWFDNTIEGFKSSIEPLCAVIQKISKEEDLTLSSGTFEPVGRYRHSLIKLLSLAIQTKRGPEICAAINPSTWHALLTDCFRFKNNTVYLNNFSNIFRGSFHIVITLLSEGDMIEKCYDFALKDENKYTGLFGYIMNWFWKLAEPLQMEEEIQADFTDELSLGGKPLPPEEDPDGEEMEDFLAAPGTPDPPAEIIEQAKMQQEQEINAQNVLVEIGELLRNHPHWSEFYAILKENNLNEEPQSSDQGMMINSFGNGASFGNIREVLSVDTNPFETFISENESPFDDPEDDERQDLIEAVEFDDLEEKILEAGEDKPASSRPDFTGDSMDDMD